MESPAHVRDVHQDASIMIPKRCYKCGLTKDVSEFSWNCRDTKKRNAMCNICHSTYYKNYWRQNRGARKKTARSRNRYIARNREFLWQHKLSRACIDCGEKDPRCLTFDHVRGKKTRCVSSMMTGTRIAIEKEIAKCVMRCYNCHAVKTFKQFRWRKGE